MNDDKLPVIKKAGLKYGFSLEEKSSHSNSNDYYIPRILISDDAFEHLIKRWDGFHEKRLDLNSYIYVLLYVQLLLLHIY